MVNVTIFDDEAESLSHTRALVEQHMPYGADYRIQEATTLEQLREIQSSDAGIDILITDVVMPEGQPSGIDIVATMFPPASGTQVIYVSGYLEQAPEVYRTAHLYFLLKPLDPHKLSDALCKACDAVRASRPKLIRIKDGHKERLINASVIRYMESNLHKVYVHCGTSVYQTYARLDDLQAQVSHLAFTRCHRSFLVNLAYVRSFQDGELLLHDDTMIPVSRRRTKQVQRDLLAYIASQG